MHYSFMRQTLRMGLLCGLAVRAIRFQSEFLSLIPSSDSLMSRSSDNGFYSKIFIYYFIYSSNQNNTSHEITYSYIPNMLCPSALTPMCWALHRWQRTIFKIFLLLTIKACQHCGKYLDKQTNILIFLFYFMRSSNLYT